MAGNIPPQEESTHGLNTFRGWPPNPDEFFCAYARGWRIPHTHIFLIPTHKDDALDRFFNALERFQESPPSLMRLRDKEQMREAGQILRDTG